MHFESLIPSAFLFSFSPFFRHACTARNHWQKQFFKLQKKTNQATDSHQATSNQSKPRCLLPYLWKRGFSPPKPPQNTLVCSLRLGKNLLFLILKKPPNISKPHGKIKSFSISTYIFVHLGQPISGAWTTAWFPPGQAPASPALSAASPTSDASNAKTEKSVCFSPAGKEVKVSWLFFVPFFLVLCVCVFFFFFFFFFKFIFILLFPPCFG